MKSWDELDFEQAGTHIVDVTPELAKMALKRNYTRNRKVRKDVVRRYAAEMGSGTWNGLASDPLKFTKSGKMLNGQHRMQAVLQSGVTVQQVVVTGLSDDDYRYMDQGQTRTVAELVAWNASGPSIAVLQTIYMLANGSTIEGSVVTARFDKQAFVDWANERHGEFEQYVSMAHSVKGCVSRGSIKAYGGALYVMDATLGEGVADALVDALKEGTPGATRLINVLMRAFMNRSKPDPRWLAGMLLQAATSLDKNGSLNERAAYNKWSDTLATYNDMLAAERERNGGTL